MKPRSRPPSRRPPPPAKTQATSSSDVVKATREKGGKQQTKDGTSCLITCTPGLESFVMDEVDTLFTSLDSRGARAADLQRGAAGEIYCSTTFSLQALQKHTSRLKQADAVYSVQTYAIPRPLALLGDQSWRTFVRQVEATLKSHPVGTFKTFALAAAGRDSSVMQRIRAQVGKQFGLADGDTQGDLHIRLRPISANITDASGQREGWETLVRLHPRPLATRDWRVCDYPGALSGPVAAVMLNLLPAAPILVNLCCGSGTLLAEARQEQFTVCIGVDNSTVALDCARSNLWRRSRASSSSASLFLGDVRAMPMGTGQINALCADLPFGNLSGTHQANKALYPALLAEAGRITARNTRFVLITHEIRLLAETLTAQQEWRSVKEYSINLRGLHPRIYVLERA